MTEFLRRGAPGMKVGSLQLCQCRWCHVGQGAMPCQITGAPLSPRSHTTPLRWLRLPFPMQSVKDMPIVQDGPPPGGFPAVRYARRVPSTGPSGLTLFAVTGSLMMWGLYQVGQSNKERRAVKAEGLEARVALLPFLQAEEDRRCVGEGGRGHGWPGVEGPGA